MTALFRPRFPLPLPSSSTSLSGRTIANLSRHLSFPTGSLPLGGKASDIRPIFPNKFFSQTNGNSQANSPPSIVLLSNPNLFPFYLSILFSKQIYIYFSRSTFWGRKFESLFIPDEHFQSSIFQKIYTCTCRERNIDEELLTRSKKAKRALRWDRVRSILCLLLRLSHDSTSLYGRLMLFTDHTFAPSFPLNSSLITRATTVIIALRPIYLFLENNSQSNASWSME